MENNSHLSLRKQKLFIGIDVHLRTWKVCIRSAGMELKCFSCEARPEALFNFLKLNFPDFDYYTVYEAGFCGFWIHYAFVDYGFKSTVINAADVPTSHKEKTNKSDAIDCKKLARELENQSLTAIYIPNRSDLGFRSAFRYRQQLSRDLRSSMLRISSFVYSKGHYYDGRNWSLGFRKWLKELDLSYLDRSVLDKLMSDFNRLRLNSRESLNFVKKEVLNDSYYGSVYKRLIGIVGIGPVCATALICELLDMKRFKSEKHLASYLGLVPSIRSSDKNVHVVGLHRRCHKVLRTLLVQAAWVAIRRDPALLKCYHNWVQRMPAQKAIIKVAKKLLNKIRYVWLNDADYIKGL